MTKRVRIQGGSSSPIRVSANDADNDDTFALIFDGNQSPLRIQSRGWVAVTRSGIPGDVSVLSAADAGEKYSAPPGLWPLFTASQFIAGGGTSAIDADRARNPYVNYLGQTSGFGGLLSNGHFYGLNFNIFAVSGTITYYVNFMIFRNNG